MLLVCVVSVLLFGTLWGVAFFVSLVRSPSLLEIGRDLTHAEQMLAARDSIKNLEAENTSLKVKPYGAALAAEVNLKLSRVTADGDAVIRFLLMHGEFDEDQISIPDVRGNRLRLAIASCHDQGLIKVRYERAEYVGTFRLLQIPDNFAAVLKDLLKF